MPIRHPDIIALERDLGIVFDGATDILTPEARMAMDAQSPLVTTSNSSIPAQFTTYIDPKVIDVLQAPMRFAEILGEAKKGDWTTETAIFEMVEPTGETAAYGDFSNNGTTGINFQFPNRQSFHYQTITQYGEKETARLGLARLDYKAKLDVSSALTLNKFQNLTYGFGVANLQLYGIANDPALPAAILPAFKAYGGGATYRQWILGGVVIATPNEIYLDFQSMYSQAISLSNGLIDESTPMVLAFAPGSAVALGSANSFGVKAKQLIKDEYPNIRFIQVPEYNSANGLVSGNFVQLIPETVMGQDVATSAFTEKMRAHAVVPGLSSWAQKKSQGTWGSIVYLPYAVTSMIGV